jgi:hypothetical protein
MSEQCCTYDWIIQNHWLNSTIQCVFLYRTDKITSTVSSMQWWSACPKDAFLHSWIFWAHRVHWPRWTSSRQVPPVCCCCRVVPTLLNMHATRYFQRWCGFQHWRENLQSLERSLRNRTMDLLEEPVRKNPQISSPRVGAACYNTRH